MISLFVLASFLSWMFMLMNHPLSLGVILLIQTITVAMSTGLASMNFWFSYILFLVMVGGMLILFIYMTSVASNEKFKLSIKLLYSSVLFILILMIINFLPMKPNIMMNNFEQKFNPLPMNISMSKYMNLPNSFLMFMMIIYLLITLIMVVKITNVKYGPLRQKF